MKSTIRQISPKVRVESGPKRMRAKATKELLSDEVTAGHYKVGALDSLGKPIKLGQPMDYVDWLNRAHVWNVYVEKNGRYENVGVFDTEDEAIARAVELAKD